MIYKCKENHRAIHNASFCHLCGHKASRNNAVKWNSRCERNYSLPYWNWVNVHWKHHDEPPRANPDYIIPPLKEDINVEVRWLKKAFRVCMDKLTDKQQNVLWKIGAYGRTHESVATELNVSRPAVSKTYLKAIELIRHHVCEWLNLHKGEIENEST